MRYSVNHSLLDRGLTSHEISWFWGWLLTDGTLTESMRKNIPYTVSWGLKYDSYPILQRLRTIADSTHPVTFRKVHNQYYTCELRIYSGKMFQRAEQMIGCKARRKTFDLIYPHNINPKFVSSLIRGIYEGDGALNMNQFTSNFDMGFTSANEAFLISIKNAINMHCLQSNVEVGKMHLSKNVFNLRFYDNFVLNQIGDWLYDEDALSNSIVMKRKYERFLLFKELCIRNSMTRKEKIPIVQDFLHREKVQCMNTLNNLKSMSEGVSNSPEYFRFRSNFNDT